MNTGISAPNFNRAKPFYPVVMQFSAQLVGFRDLVLRGISGISNNQALREDITTAARLSGAVDGKLSQCLDILCGPLEMQSAVTSLTLSVSNDEVAKEFAANAGYLFDFTMLSAGSMLILAYELCKDKPACDKGPLWEFLRHCRNAAGHGGRFTLKQYNQPKLPAKWQNLEITQALEGTPLFHGKQAGLLWPADPIRLLWDIEQAYPTLT